VDILVNSAGAEPAGSLEQLTEEQLEGALRLKLFGYMRMVRAVLPIMRARKWGRIISIGGLATVAQGDVTGFSFGGLATVAQGAVTGITVGGLATVAQGGVSGFSLGGLAVVGQEDISGISVGGVAVVGEKSISGITGTLGQIETKGSVSGLNVAGYKIDARTVKGANITAIWTETENIGYFTVGAYNRTYDTQTGLTIGLLNHAHNLAGIQIGLMNIVETNPEGLRYLPILNVKF